ncbi:uncharacterized protein FA14DRAFT_54574 [Meira miltonrushii]|uniref:Bromodomain associated domain-containing protein n=1 Tax=Meira miltonrushii TaxID=1280837 RepID=A0A316VFS8_9BASI|nr:uncharacterized protein FA14DRAFT_54574 [Meira miltonrushii]PWN36376.1 hypothetical protein FA14DRAFT_54574 [Meira miltonrushii]
MPPPHLSVPSSSTSSFASTYVQRYVRTALSSAGFARSSGQAVELLSELMERYLLVLGSSCQKNAEHAGRTKACAWDAEAALNELGISSEEIYDWTLSEDGQQVAGHRRPMDDFAGDIKDESEQQLAVQRIQDTERQAEPWLDGVKQLDRKLRNAKPEREDAAKQSLTYEEVDQDQIDLLDRLLQADASDEDSQAEESLHPSPSPTTPDSTSAQDAAANGSLALYNGHKRKRSRSTSSSHIPDFLPSIPLKSEQYGEVPQDAKIYVIEDADYERGKAARVREPTITNGHVEPADGTLPINTAEELAEAPKRSVEDLWHKAIPFQSSMLASGQTVNDLPAVSEEALNGHNTQSSMSSMHAFANDYPVLVQEARDAQPGYLTPSGPAFSRAFQQRRALASFLADASKYQPCDTLFGSISARPTVLPFHPTASLLITPPTAENPAPSFSAIRPNGRDLPSSTIGNIALYPTCRHRNPGNVLNAARFLSGGVGSETYRRMTRIHDPEPILDEQHAERVFHGQAAPKELLVEDNSILKGALDVLKLKRAEERQAAREANGSPDYDLGAQGAGTDVDGDRTGQLAMSATRDRIKVKNGTTVSTWDWIQRDYTDPQLLAKKFKQGTAGVYLSNGASAGGRDRQRSESVAETPRPAN